MFKTSLGVREERSLSSFGEKKHSKSVTHKGNVLSHTAPASWQRSFEDCVQIAKRPTFCTNWRRLPGQLWPHTVVNVGKKEKKNEIVSSSLGLGTKTLVIK